MIIACDQELFSFSGKGPSVQLITLPMTRTFFDFPRSSGYLIGSRSGVDCIRFGFVSERAMVIARALSLLHQHCDAHSYARNFAFYPLGKGLDFSHSQN